MIVVLRSLLGVSLLLTVVMGCTATRPRESAATSARVSYTVERFQRDLAVGDEVHRIRIVNPHGNVVVRNTQQRLVGVRGVVQKLGAAPESVTITLETRGDTALLEIAYPSDRTRGTDAMVDGHRKGRADLAVFVPPQVRIEISTTYGKIDVRRIDNDVVARTRDGMLVAAATGFLQLSTGSGELRAWPMSGKASEAFVLSTHSGNIVADVPLYGDISLQARTRGRLDGEADLELVRSQRAGFNQAARVVAGGAQRFEVASETGDIYLQSATRPPTPQ